MGIASEESDWIARSDGDVSVGGDGLSDLPVTWASTGPDWILLQQRDSIPPGSANLAIGQDRLQAIADLRPVARVIRSQQHPRSVFLAPIPLLERSEA